MKKIMSLKNKKGFTLVELIIVIAILAILAAIAVPAMSGYLKKANTSVANANARTVYGAAATAVAVGLSETSSGGGPIYPESIGGENTAEAVEIKSLPSAGEYGKLIHELVGDIDGYVKVTVSGSGADAKVTGTYWDSATFKDPSKAAGSYIPK